jgi:hypothetical protein
VTVTDAAAQTVTATFSITVAVAVTITTASLAAGVTGAAYSHALTAAGGTPPYTFSITGAALPPGLSIGVHGSITGVPLLAGTFSFTAIVTDTAHATGTKALSITITSGALAIATTDLPPGRLGQPYTAQFTATGGTPPYMWALTAGSLPPGLALAASGAVTGILSASGDFPFTVTVTDSS